MTAAELNPAQRQFDLCLMRALLQMTLPPQPQKTVLSETLPGGVHSAEAAGRWGACYVSCQADVWERRWLWLQ